LKEGSGQSELRGTFPDRDPQLSGSFGSDVSDIVFRGASDLGIELPPGAPLAFEKYYGLLETRSRTQNLTSISGVQDVARLHFLDSLALLNTARFKDARVIDIGSGAGFPGLPMKIADPSIDLTLLDATEKRVNFLFELCDLLDIRATCIYARAEEIAHSADKRERYDIAVSRAVAELNVLCELCLPFVRVGGSFIAMKSAESGNEVAESGKAIETLGAKLDSCIDYTIPGTDITHRAVLITKVSGTPETYPRRFARIKKAPL